MSMPWSRIARGNTCSNLSRRIWRWISQRRRASCAATGEATARANASVRRCFIICGNRGKFTIRYTKSAVFGDDNRLSMYNRFISCLTVAALLVPGLALAQAPGGENGDGINYDTARHERRLKAAQAQGRIELDGRLDEPSW